MADDSGDLKKAMFQVSDGILGAAVLIIAGMWLGNWLDAKFHTAPWFSIGLCMLGGGVGLARLVRKAMLIGDSSPSRRLAKKSAQGSEGTTVDEHPTAPRSAYKKWDDKDDN